VFTGANIVRKPLVAATPNLTFDRSAGHGGGTDRGPAPPCNRLSCFLFWLVAPATELPSGRRDRGIAGTATDPRQPIEHRCGQHRVAEGLIPRPDRSGSRSGSSRRINGAWPPPGKTDCHVRLLAAGKPRYEPALAVKNKALACRLGRYTKPYPSASGGTKCCSCEGRFVVEQIMNITALGSSNNRLSSLLDRVPTALRR
jgi:hypothetical protein